mmetsp:Transcript_17455/g.36007  ORF Transcript_17455/g.36007 Transcript_17455/m.36007 type:complete len:319 (+) Transcript_17455:634-1590(+)
MLKSWMKISRFSKDNSMPRVKPEYLPTCPESPQLEARRVAQISWPTNRPRRSTKLFPQETLRLWARNFERFKNDATLNVTTTTSCYRRCSVCKVIFKYSAVSDLQASRRFKTVRRTLLNHSARLNLVASMDEVTNGRALVSIVYGDLTRDNKVFSRMLNQLLCLWLMVSMLVFSLTVRPEVVKHTPWRVLRRITNAVLVSALSKRFSICSSSNNNRRRPILFFSSLKKSEMKPLPISPSVLKSECLKSTMTNATICSEQAAPRSRRRRRKHRKLVERHLWKSEGTRKVASRYQILPRRRSAISRMYSNCLQRVTRIVL